ncbi:MAG: hypothetical protein QMC17_05615 [Paracoccaceae bacterium]
MKKASVLLGFLGLISWAKPILAGSFSPPQGCKAFLTVQMLECSVSHHYTCEANAKGDQWRADFDAEGLFYLSRIDREAQWMESYNYNPPSKQFLDPDPVDAASFTQLLTGVDTFDFNLTKDSGEESRVTGFDQLTGQNVTIDGVNLKESNFSFYEIDLSGKLLRRAIGTEFVSPKWRTFFSGPSQWSFGDEDWIFVEDRPMKFLEPNDAGFSSNTPIFGCDAVMSQFSAPTQTMEALGHGKI